MYECRTPWLRHAGAVLLMCVMMSVQAQSPDFPARPITIVSPYSPGGSDIPVRMYMNWISGKYPKWIFVIDYKPGAQGALALGPVAKAPADGYTLAHTSSTLLLTDIMETRPAYSLEQFAPVFRFYATPQVLMMNTSVPARSLSEVVSYARANPGKLNWAMVGIAGIQRLTAESVQDLLGVKFTFVPYKGNGNIGTAIMSGEVHITLQPPRNAQSMIKTGKVAALAHTGFSGFRSLQVPDIRSFAESGALAFENVSWTAVHAPAGTPIARRSAINRMFNESLMDPEFEKAFLSSGDVPARNSIEEFEKFIELQKSRLVGTANRLGLKLSGD